MRSWREFLYEIAVVVLGIVLALSGEQLLEQHRDRHKAADARNNIRAEIAGNLAVLRNRISTQQCIDRRLDEVAKLINASTEPGYQAPSWIGNPEIWELVHARWEVVSQAGRAPLLTPDEQAKYGFIYALFADIAADQDREQIAWARFGVLEGLAHPSAGIRDAIQLDLQVARLVNSDIEGLAGLLESRSAELGIAKQAADRRGETGVCFATNTPRAEALQRLRNTTPTKVL